MIRKWFMATKDPFYKRHPDDEYYDKITIETVPRYKTSEMSGDEWRVSATMKFWRKGQLVFERTFNKMETAAIAMPWFFKTAGEGPEFKQIKDEKLCDQPGCGNDAVNEFRLKKEYSERGEELSEKNMSSFEKRRKFCERHARRGDCGLEDSDSNYEVISGPGPDGAKGFEKDVSPSQFGGVIELEQDLRKMLDGKPLQEATSQKVLKRRK